MSTQSGLTVLVGYGVTCECCGATCELAPTVAEKILDEDAAAWAFRNEGWTTPVSGCWVCGGCVVEQGQGGLSVEQRQEVVIRGEVKGSCHVRMSLEPLSKNSPQRPILLWEGEAWVKGIGSVQWLTPVKGEYFLEGWQQPVPF